MKRYLLLVLLSLANLIAFSQPNITMCEKLTPGLIQKFYVCDPNFNTGDSGANVVWDYSSIYYNKASIYTSTIHAFSDTALPDVNIEMRYSHPMYDTSFTYLHIDTTDTYIEASRTQKSKLIIDDNSYLWGNHKIKYGDTLVDSFTRKDVGYGYVKIIADGYGKLILPNATYNDVIRVKMEMVTEDTTVANDYDDHRYTYRWYDVNHISHLLYRSYSYNGLYAFGYFLESESYVDIKDVTTALDFNTNLSDNRVLLQGDWNFGEQYSLNITNYIGQKIYSGQFTPNEASVSIQHNQLLTPGIYIITVVDEYGAAMHRKTAYH